MNRADPASKGRHKQGDLCFTFYYSPPSTPLQAQPSSLRVCMHRFMTLCMHIYRLSRSFFHFTARFFVSRPISSLSLSLLLCLSLRPLFIFAHFSLLFLLLSNILPLSSVSFLCILSIWLSLSVFILGNIFLFLKSFIFFFDTVT